MKAGKHPRFRGWPRRKLEAVLDDGDIRQLPNLWIGGKCQLEGDWITFQEGREKQAVEKRLCVVCGERMEGTVVLGRMNSVPNVTDGPGGHPRCMVVAVNVCPHFERGHYMAGKNDDAWVAWRYDGAGTGHNFETGVYEKAMTSMCPVNEACVELTLGELKTLAKERPLG